MMMKKREPVTGHHQFAVVAPLYLRHPIHTLSSSSVVILALQPVCPYHFHFPPSIPSTIHCAVTPQPSAIPGTVTLPDLLSLTFPNSPFPLDSVPELQSTASSCFPPAFISPLLSDPAAYLHVGGIRRPLISSSDLISLMITVISEVIREDHDG